MLHVPDAARLSDDVREVGELAPAELLVRVRLVDHLGVEPDAGGHGEVARLAIGLEPSDVDPADTAGQQDVRRLLAIVRDPEVQREQVAGPGRDDPERRLRLREGGRHPHHRAVPTDGDDDVAPGSTARFAARSSAFFS